MRCRWREEADTEDKGSVALISFSWSRQVSDELFLCRHRRGEAGALRTFYSNAERWRGQRGGSWTWGSAGVNIYDKRKRKSWRLHFKKVKQISKIMVSVPLWGFLFLISFIFSYVSIQQTCDSTSPAPDSMVALCLQVMEEVFRSFI